MPNHPYAELYPDIPSEICDRADKAVGDAVTKHPEIRSGLVNPAPFYEEALRAEFGNVEFLETNFYTRQDLLNQQPASAVFSCSRRKTATSISLGSRVLPGRFFFMPWQACRALREQEKSVRLAPVSTPRQPLAYLNSNFAELLLTRYW